MSRYGLSLLILMSTLPGMAAQADDALPAAATRSVPAAATVTAPAAATAATPAVTEAATTASAPAAASYMAPAVAAQAATPPAVSNDAMAMPAGGTPTGNVSLPTRGMNMANVEHIYGAPLEKLPPVPAKGTPQHPPITRWVYANFVVYFEYDHVVHAVIKAHPFRDSGHG